MDFTPDYSVDSLYCQLVIIQLLSLWNGIHEVSANVCPAGTAFYAGHFIVSLVAIRFQIPLKAIQEVYRIASASCWSVSVQKNGGQTVFPSAEQLHE